ncbi:hypothetical protein C2845_PM07G12380 [Panicum miliaceum]|uniref:Uncharacterized protein n=1 Tax=Panicum miliaceum TaxID=4540 RepID=A0A3L6SN12_PANMI|nr:hypothetical protein C2845_PM07G12380 [Panicum miliaceum]
MLAHWQKIIASRSPIDITTLVMRIATYVKALDNAQVTSLPWVEEYQLKLGVEHFVQGHMLCDGPDAEKGASSSQHCRHNNSTTNTVEHSATRTSRALSPSWNLPHELRRNIQVFHSGRYEHYWRNIRIRCCPRALLPPPPGMQDPHGPQVGPSSSARYGYEKPIMRGISDLKPRVNTMGQQQDQLSIDLAHNTELIQ